MQDINNIKVKYSIIFATSKTFLTSSICVIAVSLKILTLSVFLPLIKTESSRKSKLFTLPERKVHLFSEYKEQYLKSIVDFRNMCENAIGDADMKICIENCDGYEDFQKEAIELLLESNIFALTFDVGHNHGIGGTDEDFIMKHKDRLCHIHLHDAQGRKNHLALGTGEMDIEKYINLAKEQNCRVVLETKTIDGLKQSVEWLNKSI